MNPIPETPPHHNLLAEDFIVPVDDDNPAPSPLHVWDGEQWLLPGEVELAHLKEMETDKASTRDANQRLKQQQAALKEWEEQNATD